MLFTRDDHTAPLRDRTRPRGRRWQVRQGSVSALAVGLLAIATLSGCGGSGGASPTAAASGSREAIRTAISAARAMKTYRMRQRVTLEGETLTYDVSVSAGTGIRVSRVQFKRQVFTGMVIGDDVYLKGNAEWYAEVFGVSGAKIRRTVGDRYLTLPLGQSQLKTLVATTPFFEYLADSLDLDSIPDGGKVAPGRTIDGVPTTRYEERSTSPERAVLHIANDDSHLPMLVELADGRAEFIFTDWGEPVALKKPASAETVTLDDLGVLGRGGA